MVSILVAQSREVVECKRDLKDISSIESTRSGNRDSRDESKGVGKMNSGSFNL